MPEENAAEEGALAKLGGEGRMFSTTGLTVVVVVLVAWTILLFVLLRRPDRKVSTTDGDAHAGAISDPRWLDVETVALEQVRAPVRVDESGMRVRIMLVECVVRLGPRYPEEAPDVKDLNKNYVPRVARLEPEFREHISKMVSARDYMRIQKTDVQTQLRESMVGEFNNILADHGLERRIASVTLTLSPEPGF